MKCRELLDVPEPVQPARASPICWGLDVLRRSLGMLRTSLGVLGHSLDMLGRSLGVLGRTLAMLGAI